MWTRRHKYIAYLATVFVLSLALTLGLQIGQMTVFLVVGLPVYLGNFLYEWSGGRLLAGQATSSVFWLACLAAIFAFLLLLTLPTLGALRSRGERAYIWILVQFIVLAFYFVANAVFVFRTH